MENILHSFILKIIMAKLSFPEKNNLIVMHKNKDLFHKDVVLFRKYFPHHKLNSQLASVNQFNQERLDGLMICELLDIISIDEILSNRQLDDPTVVDLRSEDEIKSLLVSEFELDEKDLEALSLVIPLWVNSSDEDIIKAVKKMLGISPEESTSEHGNSTSDEATSESSSENGNISSDQPASENLPECENAAFDEAASKASSGDMNISSEEKIPVAVKKKGKSKKNFPE